MSGNKELAAENEQLRLDLDARFEHSDHQSAKYYRRMRIAERTAEINAAQRDVALKALGEARARFGDMEQRALAAEAVIEDLRALHPVRRVHYGSSTHGGAEQYVMACETCHVAAPCAHLRAIGDRK